MTERISQWLAQCKHSVQNSSELILSSTLCTSGLSFSISYLHFLYLWKGSAIKNLYCEEVGAFLLGVRGWQLETGIAMISHFGHSSQSRVTFYLLPLLLLNTSLTTYWLLNLGRWLNFSEPVSLLVMWG